MSHLITLFESLRDIGISGLDEYDIPRIRFLNIAMIFGFVGIWTNILIDLLVGRYYPLPFIFMLLIPLSMCLYFQVIQKYSAAKFSYLGLFALAIISGQLYSPETGSEHYAFVFLLISFNVLRSRTWFLTTISLYAFYYLFLMYLLKNQILVRNPLLENTDLVYYINAAFAFFVSAIMGQRFAKENERQIRKMKTLNLSLEKQNKLAHELLRELNHRVKNNLQIVSSLFSLQGHSTDDEKTRKALKDARHRINSIAILHQKLYQDDLIFEANVLTYLESLCEYLNHSSHKPEQTIISVVADNVKLQIKETIYIGLIINELVTNALKYGEDANGDISITVTFAITETEYRIIVKDTGPGYPDGLLPKTTGSFGLSLIYTIAEQYDGSITLLNSDSHGAEIEVSLQFEE